MKSRTSRNNFKSKERPKQNNLYWLRLQLHFTQVLLRSKISLHNKEIANGAFALTFFEKFINLNLA